MKFKVHLFREYRETYEVEADNADAALNLVDEDPPAQYKPKCLITCLTPASTQSFLTAPLTMPTRFGGSS